MLLDGQREVRATLDGRVVRDDDTFLPLDDPDAGDDPGRGCLPVVQVPSGERVQLEECAARIEEPVDTLPRGQLAAGAVTLDGLLAAPPRDERRSLAQLVDERLHALTAGREEVRISLHVRGQDAHWLSVAAGEAVSTELLEIGQNLRNRPL